MCTFNLTFLWARDSCECMSWLWLQTDATRCYSAGRMSCQCWGRMCLQECSSLCAAVHNDQKGSYCSGCDSILQLQQDSSTGCRTSNTQAILGQATENPYRLAAGHVRASGSRCGIGNLFAEHSYTTKSVADSLADKL